MDLRPLSWLVTFGGTEEEDSRAGVAGSGLMAFDAAGSSRASSSASVLEARDWLRVRAGMTVDAEEAARTRRPRIEPPRPRRVRPPRFGGVGLYGSCGVSALASLPLLFRVVRSAGGDSIIGDGAFSLIGLMSSDRGWVGEPGGFMPLGRLTFFHFVEETDVLIGEGFGLCFPKAVTEVGVCGSGSRGGWSGA